MDFGFGSGDEAFRAEAREWLEGHLVGGYAELAGRGGPGSEHEGARGAAGVGAGARGRWLDRARVGVCGGGVREPFGGADQQVVWAEEYARARAPGRVGHIGENLLAPTLIAYGDEAQRRRFLPAIARGEELWCQGYSEPDAGSDLAGLRTAAVRDGGRLPRQRAEDLDVAGRGGRLVLRAGADGSGRAAAPGALVPAGGDGPAGAHRGAADPADVGDGGVQRGVLRRGGGRAGHVVGGEGAGWRVAMGLLARERGVSTLVQQIGFAAELDEVVGGGGALRGAAGSGAA